MNSDRKQNLSVGMRLGGAFGALTLLLLICVAFGVLRLKSLNQEMQSLLDHDARASVLATELVGLAHKTSGTLGRAVMSDTAVQIQDNLKETDKAIAETEEVIKVLKDTVDTDEDRAALKNIEALEGTYRTGVDKVNAAVKGGDTDAARVLLNDKTQLSAETAYLGALKEFSAGQRRDMDESKVTAQDAYSSGRNLLLITALISISVAVTLGFWITRGLLRQLGGEPEHATAITQRIAAGDLSVEIPIQTGDQSSLLHAIRSMRDSFADIVVRVRQGSDTVATASAEIAQGNNDLSARTEQQASALEETAASMEELNATVKQNAESARTANQLALSASTIAVQGGSIVGQVVETMKGINESSRKISDIISVIDGIAFQTNILALNAAVEAARAGEQGRGFAVVASEVRSLAGRSADAAKEIKSLINASVERVEQGSTLVDQAGTTMTEVVTSIKRVTDIMGEISAASHEQSSGVAQVGEAVTQMDRATQQNAALVEQMAASASSLNSQAGELVETVAVFKLDAGRHLARTTVRSAIPKSTQFKGSERRTIQTSSPLQKATSKRSPTTKTVALPKPTSNKGKPAGGENEWETF
jgi:methyl-accepting chemotaxis protein